MDAERNTQSLEMDRQPRGAQSKGGSRLEHELTNRPVHADRSRHHEHSSLHHSLTGSSGGSEHKHQHNRPAEHAIHKKLLHQQQEDELLAGERLLHVKPRQPSAALHRNTTDAGLISAGGNHKSLSLFKKAQKFAQVVAQAKATSSAKARLYSLVKAPKMREMTKEYKDNPLTKEYKGHRGGAKKYNPKKHAWKKSAHKEKLLRNRQLKRELKDRSMLSKKDKAINKEIFKAKELLRKEKALKKKEKKERREKRGKVMAYRKRE